MKKIILAVAVVSLAANVFAQTTLKDAYGKYFLIGAALNPAEFCESNSAAASLVKKQLNSITPENVLKWEAIHPGPGEFDFALPDRYVQFGVSNKMFIVGHNLIWHSQTPPWVFEGADHKPVDRDTLLARMREHIFTVVGRYKGKIGGWDVVNEALSDNGQLRPSPWRKIIGDDYLLKAYQYAHEADSNAELYYNDYGLESSSKQTGAIALIQKLQAEGVKVAGVGLQGHYRMDHPTTEQVDHAITAFSKLGIKVMITELDINFLPSAMRVDTADVSFREADVPGLNPYTNGLPDSVQLQLTQRYASLFATFFKHRKEISRITFWGLTDDDSWLNDWPIKGRTAYPLLFGRDLRPKPAFNAVLRVAAGELVLGH
jgi:endo-1,4-beta-xylanase